jgi:hypothetical protein
LYGSALARLLLYTSTNDFKKTIPLGGSMKKFILVLMVAATIVSCGKDNKVSSGDTAAVGITNPIVSGSSIAQQLLAQVNSGATAFGNGYLPTSNSNSNCDKVLKIFTYCTYSSSGTGSGETWNQALARDPGMTFVYLRNNQNRLIDNGAAGATVASQQQRIRDLINSATEITGNGIVYYIRTATGIYAIDIRYAIQMNPAATQEPTFYEYFLRAM